MQLTPPRNLTELFTGFLAIGARSFGGVMPWAYRTMVEERRWLAPADFAETIGLCQFLPGPNIGNASIVLGKRWFGVTGVGATGAGLFIGTALKLGRALAKSPAALVLIAGCFLTVGVGRISMLIVMPAAALIGVLFARRGWL